MSTLLHYPRNWVRASPHRHYSHRFLRDPSLFNPFTQMAAQQPSQAQLQPNHSIISRPPHHLVLYLPNRLPFLHRVSCRRSSSQRSPSRGLFFHCYYPLTKICFLSSTSWTSHLHDMRCILRTCIKSVLIPDTGWPVRSVARFCGHSRYTVCGAVNS